MNCKIKFLSFILIMVVFFGCKSIEFEKVKKQVFTSGYKLGTTKIRYTTTVTSKKEFKIVSLEIDKIDQEFKNFSIIELPSGKMKKLNQNLMPGKYFIELSVPENLVAKESIDLLTLEISLRNVLMKFKSETFLEENLLGR